jgi:hypothetical protein
MIPARKASLAGKTRPGVVLGDPGSKEPRAKTPAAKVAAALVFAESVAPNIREAQAEGANSLRLITAELNARNIPAATGKRWNSMMVGLVLRRLQMD